MTDPEVIEYRRVLARLVHTDDVQDRHYLLESDRSEIEKVMDQNDKVSAANRQAFSSRKSRGGP
ncbi:MAG: hypothetical protein IH991_24175 [Planctomycetes bacterium]|nr:hypothetical protein [Planctomycetota bacterium]